ncbi:hypothetical protein JZ751_013257 [Albula glossodonta]|uniref:G-protein coupled receptors family 1 profile domain-containing protein n=1 Tax=Albula glossodonta TaxID=121402 RepID=A0A8T2NSG5_9TELE|nr:hypothetical protein JZ751_013257 [Albula glossodonta]
MRYYLTTMYTLEFCLGFLGNLIVILGYIFCLKKWMSINVYLFNLTVSDMVFLCTLPRLVHNYIQQDREETSPYFCIINRLILHLNLYSNILFMLWVSVDRYLLILNPFRQHVLLRRTTAIWVSVFTWVIVCVQMGPLTHLMIQDQQKSNWTKCNDFSSLNGTHINLVYSLTLTVIGYILPLLAMSFTTCRIALFLKAQEGIVENGAGRYRKTVQVVAAATAMFFALYTPYHVMLNVRIASRLWNGFPICKVVYIEGAFIITRPILFAHSVINPIFYFLMGDNFRELLLGKLKMLTQRHLSRNMSFTM